MGGLIARYALARVQRGHRRFPPRLWIPNVVTLGTPHRGAPLAHSAA
jgi:triacylglycerol esterase/lipase EstA (alpha/beta hydrolase family)